MRLFYIFLLLFLFSSAHSQTIEVTYKPVLSFTKETHEQLEFFQQTIGNPMDMIEEIEFILLFNPDESLFYNIEKTYSSKWLAEGTLALCEYSGRVKQKNNINYVENDRDQKAIVTHSNHNWQLVNEQKTIDNYVCYKAVAVYTYYSESIDKTFQFPVEAWYCPELNYPFGPNGQGGLPGLILEYKFRNAVYGATEIKFHKEKMDIPTLKDYPHYTFEEFDRMIGEMNKHRLIKQ